MPSSLNELYPCNATGRVNWNTGENRFLFFFFFFRTFLGFCCLSLGCLDQSPFLLYGSDSAPAGSFTGKQCRTSVAQAHFVIDCTRMGLATAPLHELQKQPKLLQALFPDPYNSNATTTKATFTFRWICLMSFHCRLCKCTTSSGTAPLWWWTAYCRINNGYREDIIKFMYYFLQLTCNGF